MDLEEYWDSSAIAVCLFVYASDIMVNFMARAVSANSTVVLCTLFTWSLNNRAAGGTESTFPSHILLEGYLYHGLYTARS